MRPSNISGLIHVGLDILSTTVNEATKRILAQIGDVVKEAVDSDGVEWWQHVGLASRPPKPEAKKQAAQAVVLKTSDRDVAIASVDQRGLSLYDNLEYGETCLYAAGEDGEGQARILLKANGNIALYTAEGNVEGGGSVTIQCNSDGELHLGSSNGGISVTADGIVIAHSSGAAIQLNSSGITLIGTGIALNGGSVSLGANATMPVVWGPAGISGVGSTSVKVAI